MKNVFKTQIAALVFGLAAVTAFAQAPTGLDIMTQVYERPQGDSMTANLQMVITNNRGAVRTRELQQNTLEADGVERKLLFFRSPADIKDTSFMTWSYDDGRGDDQWIYLPAVRRVKRISSDSQGEAFMGSDFTYEDLSPRHPSRDSHRLLREETIDAKTYWVVESTPVDAASYSKVVTWIDRENFIGFKREFYNARGQVNRILEVAKAERIDGWWVILDMSMRNVERNTSTRFQMTDVEFNTGLTVSYFTERRMTQGVR